MKAWMPFFLCATLAACQNKPFQTAVTAARPATAGSESAMSVKTPVSGSKSPVEETKRLADLPLSAHIQGNGQTDKLVLTLAPNLLRGFKTQAFDISQTRYLRIWVKGPGISGQISGPLIDLLSPEPISLSGIPIGPNRIVTAQFYDNAQNPLTIAVAKAFYSSGNSPGGQSLQLRRRYLPLAEILEALLNSSSPLAGSLDLNALQAMIDQRLYPGGVVGPVFATDPALLRTDLLATELLNQSGVIASVNFLDPAYVKTTGSLQIMSVNGLVAGDRVLVRVDDPTSPPALHDGLGPLDIGNILPGTWPVTITLPPGLNYSVVAPSDPVLSEPKFFVNFVAGNQVVYSTLTLDYPGPIVNSVSVSQGPRGTDLVIEGNNFHTRPSGNTVNFQFTGDSSITPATVLTATPTRLTLKVPPVTDSGDYNIQVSVGAKTAANQPFKILRVWHVAPDGNDAANGADWNQATTLTNALGNAGSGDEIWLKAGVYTPSQGDRNQSFVISTSLTLLGGFAGNELSSDTRNPQVNKVFLSGDLNGDENLTTATGPVDIDPAAALRADNSYHVVKIENSPGRPVVVPTQAVLDGLSIVGGNANDNVTDPCNGGCPDQPLPNTIGGGILNNAGVTLRQVTLRYNSALADGGGLYYSVTGFDGDLNIGKYRNNNEPLRPCLFEYNRAGGSGGGLYISGPDSVRGSTFRYNQARNGGGIEAASGGSEGHVEMYGNVIEANQASEDGGGIHALGNLEIYQNIFANNTAGRDGGGLFRQIPAGFGGGENNVFASNSAQRGGGAYLYRQTSFAEAIITGWTFFKNQASIRGSGIYFTEGDVSNPLKNLRLRNTLFYDDTVVRASDSSFIFERSLFNGAQAAFASDDGSFTQPALIVDAVGPSFFNTDPLFSDPVNPAGGDGWGTGIEGLRPQSASPAKGAGTYVSVNPGDVDAGGTPRLGANPTDMGAYVIP